MSSFFDESLAIVSESGILEKFEGEVEDGVLVERVYIEDGLVIKVEKFEDGELVHTEIRGGDSDSDY